MTLFLKDDCYLFDHVGILQRGLFVTHKATPHISSAFLRSCGQLLLLSRFTVLWLSIKLMWRIWKPCFTCMFGVCKKTLYYITDSEIFLGLRICICLGECGKSLIWSTFFAGTSLVVTVIRSFGNNHSHLGPWCWTQTGLKGKARENP